MMGIDTARRIAMVALSMVVAGIASHAQPSFAVTQPVVTLAKVTGAPPHQQLVLNGSGFTGLATVLIGPMANVAPATQSDTQLTFNLPQPLADGTYALSLKVAAGTGARDPFYIEEAYVAVGSAVVANIGSLSCTTNQIIKWSGTAWVCTSDTLTALNCTVNQSIGWNGTAWVCRSAPIVATLSRLAGAPPCCGIPNMFAAYSPNVDPAEPCDFIFCTIRLVDVVDHTSCQVNFTGNSFQGSVVVLTSTTAIVLQNMFTLNSTQPFYVNISCAT